MIVFGNIIEDAFAPLINLFEAILVFLHNSVFGGSWGLSIVALTVVVRAALVPLTLRQLKSMQAMQRLAPEMKALQQKYKEDKQRLNQEMMKFYSENKVNPFASCIPLVLQLPVFISLFYMLRANLKLDICGQQLHDRFGAHIPSGQLSHVTCDSVAHHSAKFLFIPDITAKTTGAVLVTLIVLYIGSQLVSSVMTTVNVDKNQRRLMLALPFFFTIFIFQFPGGLLVYWITTNMWTIGQQWVVRKRMPPLPPPAPAKGGDKGGASSPNGGGASSGEPALAGVGTGARSSGPPPRSPRKKKKRSGRRR